MHIIVSGTPGIRMLIFKWQSFDSAQRIMVFEVT